MELKKVSKPKLEKGFRLPIPAELYKVEEDRNDPKNIQRTVVDYSIDVGR